MNPSLRAAGALLILAVTLTGTDAFAQEQASAQQASTKQTQLTSQQDKASYMVGHDVARSIAPVAPDLDIASFQRAIENAFAGNPPLINEAQAQATGQALIARVQARAGQAPAGAAVPDVDTRQVGLLVGADVGRSLAPISDRLDVAVLVQAVRDTFAGGELLLSAAELTSVRQAFTTQVQGAMQAKAAAAASSNRLEGEKLLAANRQVKGVFTTSSGLQYMVLRPGAGPKPTHGARVRVNYEGRLPDGTVFDSSYERGEPAVFALDQVIAGWTEGVSMMPVGAKYRFWIPGDLAYGARGAPGGDIGPNQMLVFDVELQAILP